MLTYEARQRIKEALDIRKRDQLGKSFGFKFSTRASKYRQREKYHLACLRNCGRLAWHPPYGSGRCASCAQQEQMELRKERNEYPFNRSH